MTKHTQSVGAAQHQQHHHHQPGAMYQTMIPAAIPSNVFINNVTANVNLHGWAHTVPYGAWVHPGGPHYLHGDMPPEQGAPVLQQMGAKPVTLPTPNALGGPVMNPNAISAMPVYNGQHMYNYGYYLPPVMNQSEYQYGDEDGVGSPLSDEQAMYADEYGMSPADMHTVSSDDMNHNASSMSSANETANLLSPNYPPMSEQMSQQMGVMHIYDDQPQTKNYGATKMPSSPISSAPSTMERKTSESSDTGKGQTQQQQQQQQQQTTSTASTTAAPHQFQQPQSPQTSPNDAVQIQSTTAATATSAGSATTIISSKPHSQQYPPGVATKKHSFSNQGHSGASATTNTAQATTSSVNTVETPSTPAINSTPPVSATTPAAPSTPSWASLFRSSANTASTVSSNPVASTSYSKKPIAKVAPYEGPTPPPPVVTPGTLSYSAVAAQNLSPKSASAVANKKATSSEQQSQRNSLSNLDEYSLKFSEFLTKYKSDWAPISLRPRGLTNRSNYCYINSILQALLGCSPLYNLIRSIPIQAANLCEVKTPTINAMIKFMSKFSNLPSGLRLRNTKAGKRNKDNLGGEVTCDPAF